MKKYYITLDGKLLFKGLSHDQVVQMTRHTCFNYEWVGHNYEWVGQFGKLVGRNAPTLLIHEDELVNYQYDSVEDQYGWSWHTIITSLEGQVLVDQLGGDWTGIAPDASLTEPVLRGKVECMGL